MTEEKKNEKVTLIKKEEAGLVEQELSGNDMENIKTRHNLIANVQAQLAINQGEYNMFLSGLILKYKLDNTLKWLLRENKLVAQKPKQVS